VRRRISTEPHDSQRSKQITPKQQEFVAAGKRWYEKGCAEAASVCGLKKVIDIYATTKPKYTFPNSDLADFDFTIN
jgi:hypothetical protein